MKKTTTIFAAVAILGVGYYGYLNFFFSKRMAATYINRKIPTASLQGLMGQNAGYVIARAKAVRANKNTFKFRGQTFVTATGRTTR
jgi:hypothetical protein